MPKVKDQNWQLNNAGGKILNHENLSTMQNLLNQTGAGFCLAKWKQVTIHLGTGMTHSCHHPSPHKIPLEELKENPSALHNTEQKKQARREMLQGGKPSECDYCWRVEDQGSFSDRTNKSFEPWAINNHDNVAELTGDENVFPSYLEVSFSNVCNLKCTYCGPEYSSKWVEDINHNGPVKLMEGTPHEQWSHGWQDINIYKNREQNPYVDAFWEWWPEAYKHLRVFRITGGEPLMSKETFRILDWFIDNPNPEMELSMNSNLSVPDKLWDRFIDKIDKLKDSDNIKSITVFTSVEGWGKRAEYARTGLDFHLLRKRYEQLVSMGNIRCVIMSTYNIFSISSLQLLLEWQLKLRKKYNTNRAQSIIKSETGFSSEQFGNNNDYDPNWKHTHVVGIDIPYLRHPTFLDARYCTTDLVEDYMLPCLDYMNSNTCDDHWSQHRGFEVLEYEKFKRIVMHRIHWIKKSEPERDKQVDVTSQRAKFYQFVNTMDKRNNTDFLTTFPEYESFYKQCEQDWRHINEQ